MTAPRALCLALLLASGPAGAQAPVQAPVQVPVQLDMSGISIIGDQELPNVLYVVPWKDPEPVRSTARIDERPEKLLPDHMKRNVMQRQLRYQQEFAGAAGAD